MPPVRRLAATVIVASLISACDSSQALAQDILRRSVPPGESAPPLSQAIRSTGSAQFMWDIDTHRDDYATWVRQQLLDFEVVTASPAQLRMAKMVGGDACRLLFVIEPRAGVTHVHVEMTERPD